MTKQIQLSPATHSSESTSGTTYVQQQVAEKGLPQPQAGGKKSYKKHRRGGSKSMRKGKRSSKKGGFLQKALVPFGLFALQKRTQKRRSGKAHKKYHKKTKGSKKSRR
jgi:hypothetical protein